MLPSEVPKSLPTALGPIPVTVVRNLKSEDMGKLMGLTRFRERTIELDADMARPALWATFWHEAIHMALFDSGVANSLNSDVTEAVCDAVGTFLTAAMAQGFLKVAKAT